MKKLDNNLNGLAPEAGERSEAAGGANPLPRLLPSPQAKPVRRSFTAEYKLRILEEADRATIPGQIGLLLRREGLYSSHLGKWRLWRKQCEAGLSASHKGPRKDSTPSALRLEIDRLQRQNQQLQKKLKHANLLIELQKKLNQTMAQLHDNDETLP